MILAEVDSPIPHEIRKPTKLFQVGDVYAQIGPSKTILHEEVQERDCAIVTFGYEGEGRKAWHVASYEGGVE